MKSTLAIPIDGSATGYHRVMQPLHTLHEKGRPIQFLGPPENQPGQYAWADVLYVQCLYAPGAYQFYAQQIELGKKLICDFDDDYFNIPPDSPEQTEIIDHQTGESYRFSSELRVLWVKLFLDLVDTLVVTTEELKTLYQPFSRNEIVVIPNCITQDMKRDIPKLSHNKTRILWTGSASHLPDLSLLQRPLQNVYAQLGDKVEFHFQGPLDFAQIFPDIPVISHAAVGYGEYLNVIQAIDADIVLMPLQDNLFNAGKSALKYSQMSLLEMATVASNFGPYSCITHGENGLLCSSEEDWLTSILHLVGDSKYRESLQKAALDYVMTNHSLSKHLPRWEYLLR